MKVTVIDVEINESNKLFKYVCKHLFKHWEQYYKDIFEINSANDLEKYYTNFVGYAKIYAALNENGKFLGCYSLSRKGITYWITDVYVIPESRGKGIGSILIKHAVGLGNYHFALTAAPELVPFYEKFGFLKGNLKEIKGKNDTTYLFHQMYRPPILDNYGFTVRITLCILVTIAILCLIYII
uniref:N-acetyltransferase domain-containing protein n=1 Tax=viral metagenome TaxID=1070528 RepID=A0A6C0BES4_9ZZZZ